MSELDYQINYAGMVDALQIGGVEGAQAFKSSRTSRGLGTPLDTEKYVRDKEDRPSLQKRILESLDNVQKENESMAEKMKALGIVKDPVTGDLEKTLTFSKSSGVTVDKAYDTSFKLIDDLKKDYDLTTEQAAAFVGNLWHETMGFKAFQELKPTVPGSKGGLGFAQWTGSRRVNFEDYLKEQGNLNADDYTANYGFLKQELDTTQKKVLKSLEGIVDIKQATEIISADYFSPGKPQNNKRVAAAEDILQRYNEDRSLM